MHFFVLEGKEEKYEMENPESAYKIGSEGEKSLWSLPASFGYKIK